MPKPLIIYQADQEVIGKLAKWYKKNGIIF